MTAGEETNPTAGPIEPMVSRGREIVDAEIEEDVSVHVFSVSAGLVGVCLTVIGIIRIGINVRSGYNTVADELLAADSICFMAACLLAYSSLRTSGAERGKRFEAYADRLFVIGMATMCIACGLVAFSLL